MSHKTHAQSTAEHGTHGTILSYVTGFVLSLLFTFIPYYLVVNKVISGTALLATILAIGVLQMAIQMFFFLHLGRGPKPLYNIVFFFATAGVVVVTIGASLFIMDNLYRNMAPEELVKKIAQQENITQVGGLETGACGELRESHIVTITNGTVYPIRTDAGLCDTLTFVNRDETNRDITFADYFGSTSYGGEDKVTVSGGKSETITLNQLGDFSFIVSADPNVSGYFIVAE